MFWAPKALLNKDHFRDPVHGFIELNPLEIKIVDSAPFQRLRKIHQLALSHLVYHGAEHTRFGHSLGVMHLATVAYNNVIKKYPDLFSKEQITWYEQVLRLVALTHDLGHPPFSHASEEILPDGLEHEDYTEKIIKETSIADYINEIGSIFVQEYGEEFNITPDLICNAYRGKSKDKNLIFLMKFMDSELDVDKMDYLLRDSLYCGVSYGKYDLERLITSLTVHGSNAPRLSVKKGGMHAVEAFILARYFMFMQVYFHKIRRIYDLMLSKFLEEVLPVGKYPSDTKEFLDYTDDIVWALMNKEKENSEWASRIINRKLMKMVSESPPHSSDNDKKIYNMIVRAIKRKCGDDNIIYDSASKLPHKIPTRVDVEDEKAIPVTFETEEPISLSDHSEIVRSLTTPINIIRIYAKDNVYDQAKEIYEAMQRDAKG